MGMAGYLMATVTHSLGSTPKGPSMPPMRMGTAGPGMVDSGTREPA
jgi:hypothetical protein